MGQTLKTDAQLEIERQQKVIELWRKRAIDVRIAQSAWISHPSWVCEEYDEFNRALDKLFELAGLLEDE